MDQDKLLRTYTRLMALKQNLPDYTTHEKYIKEYHEIVNDLAKEIKMSLDEFIIPGNEIKKRLVCTSPYGNKYSDDNYCDRSLLLSKLDALLSYFQIKYLSQKEPEIGFNDKK